MTIRPPKMFCRECGREIGRGWTKAALCDGCKANDDPGKQRVRCDCDFPDWNEECPVHDHDPFDIPF